ncbi:LytTr DNA-binding domain-containing protein [Ekhidna lutea]|uniref:LytTr DNA-binding domain-containing protein n=1 Tax=Ekhidna lutea TaxID=447679 RepID=A0A239LWH2_EKHLU|nr:LytTR family DNA-binding domain-containing protein [Ekhidna lutea]SNT34312.1 LytTr DNA-binding domain-containing protein [Ekhidna lutea]
MNLNEIKFRPLEKKTQVIVFDQKGKVLETDNTLVEVNPEGVNIFEDTILCGMEEQFLSLKKGEQVELDCIHTDFFGKESHYDFVVMRLEEENPSYGLVIYDFGAQYNQLFDLQQERNMAQIQSHRLERENKELVDEKTTIERLYNEMKDDSSSSQYILVKADSLLYNLDFKEILYLEAYGDYIKVHTENKVYVTHNTMKRVEEILPANRFFRVHRSFIVQLSKIENIEQMSLLIRGKDKVIPIGKSYKSILLQKMDQL